MIDPTTPDGSVAYVTELSHEQRTAIQVAHDLVDLGTPIFTAFPDHSGRGEYLRPNSWQTFNPHHRQVEIWRPGAALCMVTGVTFDVIDVDPRNGGTDGILSLADMISGLPEVLGLALTPSQGEHRLIRVTGLRKSAPAPGVDHLAGDRHGEGRGYIYIAPTVRVSKYGPQAGQEVAYRWAAPPVAPDGEDPKLAPFIEYVSGLKRTPVRAASALLARNSSNDDPFTMAATWTADEADRLIAGQLEAVASAREGAINATLGGAARVLGRFVAGGYLSEEGATAHLLAALERGGVHSDSWNVANGRTWTARTVIGAGLANGGKEPWTVDAPDMGVPLARESVATAGGLATSDREATRGTVSGKAATPPNMFSVDASENFATVPPWEILSAGNEAYALQNAVGTGPLAGLFLRDSRIVHTPRIGQEGYVPPRREGDDNGPVQIRELTAGQLAAKVQYAYRCYKTVKGKGDAPDIEVPALFPLQAAQRAVDAPEAMPHLRPLAGVTLTPMVRADGSVLAEPGYDEASNYLFLPGAGVNVPAVPADPSDDEVARAVALLDEMVAGFPWETKDDKANYYGLLLTPLLRLLAPPTYKMFGIGAHQPGSGKTLLADIATILHGGVLRAETPEDEPEWRKQITSILSTTSAPVIHVDNVTGVLKSSTLAGMLTAGQESSDRELGSSRMITTVNDRVWVVTGNNLSLGGDLVRRTIIIAIDPNMADPESREFAIPDLKAWVADHRNQLLWALLVMVRRWVSQGSVPAVRGQSDSFARWEAVVAGILAACKIPGDFDHQSGKRAAAGGDDDGLTEVLVHLYDRFGDRLWSAAEALDGHDSADFGEFVAAGRDWLPAFVLEKLARSESGGRKSFGRYLLNRVGRWVSNADGHAYVVRQGGATRSGAMWRIDKA